MRNRNTSINECDSWYRITYSIGKLTSICEIQYTIITWTTYDDDFSAISEAFVTKLSSSGSDLEFSTFLMPKSCSSCQYGASGIALLDGKPVLSCLVLGVECEGREVETVEGLATRDGLHPLQDAFADLGGAQCGYCTPGILVTAKALLDRVPNPSREQIRETLSGTLCRCTGYLQIVEGVEDAVQRCCASKSDEVDR